LRSGLARDSRRSTVGSISPGMLALCARYVRPAFPLSPIVEPWTMAVPSTIGTVFEVKKEIPAET